MEQEELMLNTVDDYCCLCGWWHTPLQESDHKPLVTLAVFNELLAEKYRRERGVTNGQ